jgi:hypothetical protein
VSSSRRVVIGDFLSESLPTKHYDVIFTNPPFSLAMKFVEKCLATADHVVMLLRLGFLGSADRANFFRRASAPTSTCFQTALHSLMREDRQQLLRLVHLATG